MSVFKENESYRPFTYSWAIEAAKKQSIDMHWDVHEVELQDDLRQYNDSNGLATPNVSHATNKRVLDTALFVFTELDRTVADGYVKLLPYTKNNEIKVLFLAHAHKESIHQRAYALAAETFGFSDADWALFKEYKEMRDKIEIMSSGDFDLSKPLDYAKALTQILLSEGIGLFGPFTILLNMKRHGILVGFNDVNQWSLADETAHVENNIKVVKSIEKEELSYAEQCELKRYSEELAHKLCIAEKRFVELLFGGEGQEGLTEESVLEYMEFLERLRLFQLGYKDFSEVGENPLPWMDWILSAEKHDNFFEKKVTSYSHDKLKGDIDYTRYQQYLGV